MKTHRIAMPHLLNAAANRASGYLESVLAAAIETLPTHIVLTDEDYVRLKEQFPPLRVPSGPGTELSKLLKKFGINPTPTCQCRAKAAEMDAWGPDECSKPERIEEVLTVMREEAKARGLPFLDVAGRLLIRRAIANARRAAAG